jgi:hypothetical protein
LTPEFRTEWSIAGSNNYATPVGSWIQLNFVAPQVVNTLKFQQRRHNVIRSRDLRVTFSDGSTAVVTVANDILLHSFPLPAATTTSVKLTIQTTYSGANDPNTGAQLIELWGPQSTATVCAVCAAGMYSTTSGLASCITCNAGSYTDTLSSAGGTSCTACTAGQYSNAPTVACAACADGTTAVSSGAPNCTTCGAGQFSAAPTTPCVACLPGTVATWGAGVVALSGATNCTACSAGEYTADPVVACQVCSAGSVTDTLDQPGGSSCTPCAAGRYAYVNTGCGATVTSACLRCSIGEYSAAGASQCVNCVGIGMVDSDNDPTTPCLAVGACAQICPPNTEDADCDASTNCTSCAPGNFSAGGIYTLATRCAPCGPGYVDQGAASCVPCPPGAYQPGVGSACILCEAGRFSKLSAADSVAACEACSTGQYSSAGSPTCTFCAAGQADTDSNASTVCSSCAAGRYAGCGTITCARCAPGKVDADSNPATPCTACPAGQSWQAAGTNNSISTCILCQAGRYDNDTVSTTACVQCNAGTYAAAGATACTVCADFGLQDGDADPSTPCVANGAGQCVQVCSVGWQDDDCDVATPCTECVAGQYSPGGLGLCTSACPAGAYAPRGSDPAAADFFCVGCAPGFADTDSNAWTNCTECVAGHFTAQVPSDPLEGDFVFTEANATSCKPCLPGTIDTDGLSNTTCAECAIGKASSHLGSTDASHCVDCQAGRWSAVNGSAACVPCPATMYRRKSDKTGCRPCKLELGERCDVPGMVAPLAQPGYYATDISATSGMTGDTAIVQCTPFQACVGTCPVELIEVLLSTNAADVLPEDMDLLNCAAGLEAQSCVEGYKGPKCATCVPVDSSKDCNDASTTTSEKGYYRLDQRCEPCPCSWFGFKSIVVSVIVLVFCMLALMDKLYNDRSSEAADYISTKTAPLVIILTFAQTLGETLLYERWQRKFCSSFVLKTAR